jgi:MSHA pilin protein MshB
MQSKKKSTGFTLIELVVVIAILGILAAVALPRFIDATKDAHEAAVRGTSGALASAVLLVRAQFELNRNGGSNGCVGTPANCQINVQGFGNELVDVNANGWPVGTTRAGTPAAGVAMSIATCNQVFTNILQGSAPTVGAAATNPDYVTTAAGTNCVFTYQADGANDSISYNANTGEVTVLFN